MRKDVMKTLLLMALKQSGSYSPDDTLHYIEEQLQHDEYEYLKGLLEWISADLDQRKIGPGNWDTRLAQYERSPKTCLQGNARLIALKKAGSKVKPTITKIVPFLRQEKGKVSTIALLRLTLTKELNNDQIENALTTLVTKWVKDTKEGRKAWQDSGADLNIGDLAMNDTAFLEWVPHAQLTKYGIQDLEFLEVGDTEGSIEYDKILVNQEDLPDDWHMES